MKSWQIQEAKAHLSELVRDAEQTGPQSITRHGREVAVVVSRADYERLTGAGQSLVDFMRQSPLFDADDTDLARDPGPIRSVVI
jgi:prevent-host-death family protein